MYILREKSLAISYNGFSLRRSFSIISFLLASVQTCQLFENDLMAARKRSKKQITISSKGFDLLSILISNAIPLKGRSFEKILFLAKTCTKMVKRTFSFKPFFTFWLYDLNI